jgi:hypothetical protein
LAASSVHAAAFRRADPWKLVAGLPGGERNASSEGAASNISNFRVITLCAARLEAGRARSQFLCFSGIGRRFWRLPGFCLFAASHGAVAVNLNYFGIAHSPLGFGSEA